MGEGRQAKPSGNGERDWHRARPTGESGRGVERGRTLPPPNRPTHTHTHTKTSGTGNELSVRGYYSSPCLLFSFLPLTSSLSTNPEAVFLTNKGTGASVRLRGERGGSHYRFCTARGVPLPAFSLFNCHSFANTQTGQSLVMRSCGRKLQLQHSALQRKITVGDKAIDVTPTELTQLLIKQEDVRFCTGLGLFLLGVFKLALAFRAAQIKQNKKYYYFIRP